MRAWKWLISPLNPAFSNQVPVRTRRPQLLNVDAQRRLRRRQSPGSRTWASDANSRKLKEQPTVARSRGRRVSAACGRRIGSPPPKPDAKGRPWSVPRLGRLSATRRRERGRGIGEASHEARFACLLPQLRGASRDACWVRHDAVLRTRAQAPGRRLQQMLEDDEEND